MNKLILILPCFNEEEILPTTIKQIDALLKSMVKNKLISDESYACFIDDGSNDNTWNIIEEASTDRYFNGIKLSRNYGHQNALLAGLESLKNTGDCYISLDADLQDDINTIVDMVVEFNNGINIVYAVRKKRDGDTFFKRNSAKLFYGIQKKLGIDIVENHSDYRLISNTVLNYLFEFKERNIYLRAIIPLIGFKSKIVFYDRKKRVAGKSKYPLLKMLSFAWDGITSFSRFPLKLITIIGAIIFIASMGMSVWIIIMKILFNETIPGWASTTVPIYFIGGVQLLSLGIIGEYVGKIYIETKQRPRYFIDKNTKETSVE